MDEDIFDRIFSVAAAAWAAVAMLAVRLFHTWPNVMDRLNERKRDAAVEKAGDWDRIRDERDRLQARVQELEQRNAILLEQNFELLGRAVIAEGELVARDKAEKKATMLGGAEGVADAQSRRGNGDGDA